MAVNERKIALKVLEEVESGSYLNLVLKRELSGIDEREKRFISALCFSLIENKIRIDYVIAQFTKGKRLHSKIKNILRLGVCQILFFDSVPDSAAVNECVKLAESSPKRQLKGFVNAVLRQIARDKDNIVYPDRNEDFSQYLSVMYSYPKWICDKYIQEYGGEFAEQLISYKKPEAETCVRNNGLKVDVEKLKRKLVGAAFKISPGRYMDNAVYIQNITAVDELGMYQRGELTVQQEASMLVVKCADIKKGMKVIDVCAAPGGKSAFAAEFQPSRLVALELHEHRAQIMKKNFERLGITAEISVGDARVPRPEFYGKFDRALVDAPCSALGLLYRKPDIKMSKNADELLSLAKIDAEILQTASRYVAPGGRIVYSTCTIDRLENDCVVDDFLRGNASFREKQISQFLPEGLCNKAQNGRIQLFPCRDGIDGFFISVLERVK